MVALQVERHAAEECRVRHPVDHRVEETPALAGALRGFGDRPIEEVVGAGENQQHNGDHEVTLRNAPRGRHGEDETRRGEDVSGESRAHQPPTDGGGASIYRLAELSVEHLSPRS
jgi:hypothetical protein